MLFMPYSFKTFVNIEDNQIRIHSISTNQIATGLQPQPQDIMRGNAKCYKDIGVRNSLWTFNSLFISLHTRSAHKTLNIISFI